MCRHVGTSKYTIVGVFEVARERFIKIKNDHTLLKLKSYSCLTLKTEICSSLPSDIWDVHFAEPPSDKN